MSALINHAQYQPTPRDMLIALKAIADATQALTGKTPNILVGTSKLYPPKAGQVMSKKAAVAAHEALYGDKGALIVKDGSTPVFKQTNGAVTKDELGLEKKINPTPVNEAREQYQELLSKHPDAPTTSYEDRLTVSVDEQKAADKMVAEMAAKEGITPEAFGEILAQGSAFVNNNLDTKIQDDGPKISEGLAYLAESGTAYREAIATSIEAPQEKPEIPSLDDALELDPPIPLPEITEDALLDIPIAQDAETLSLDDEITRLGKQLLSELGGNPQEIESGLDIEASPAEEPVIEPELPSEAQDPEVSLEPAFEQMSVLEADVQSAAPVAEPIAQDTSDLFVSLDDLSSGLTADQRFAPGKTPASEPLDATIAQLSSKIEELQSEIKSMKKTMDKIANKEPIPKIRSWAQKQANGIMNKMQDRAKVDIVKTVNFGKELAQKAMDKIAQKAGEFEGSTLKVDSISSDLKTMFDIHDNAPSVTSGDYTFTNKDGNISVNHKDRGEVFAISEKGASFKGNFNADDYRKLSSVREAVAVIAGPAAIAAEVAKDLAVGAVKEGAQKNAIKM